MADELDTSDATGLAAAIRTGALSARDAVAASLRRIEERNAVLNAIVAVRDGDEVLADLERHPPTGPLAGVPFVVKDLGAAVAGLPSTSGSRLWAGAVATADSEIVARYRRAGLVPLAMTNTPELGRNASTEPLLFGPTRNPHSLAHSAGGSSGGTAAAVAAGMVPAGHGNDGGGSIRIPASACGLVGLKPSRARTPSHPRRSLFAYPLGVNHALTRTVRDSALLLDIAAGPVAGDPYVVAPPARPYVDEVGAPPGRLRVAVSTTMPNGDPVDPQCADAAVATAKLLAELGHEIVEDAAPDYPLDALTAVMSVCMIAPLVVDIDGRLVELGRKLRDDDLEPFTRVLYDVGTGLTAADMVRALQEVERTATTIGAFFADHDLLLTPTIARPAPRLGVLDTTDVQAMYTRAATYSAMTSPFNVSGQPAISLPTGVDGDGVPIGVQLVAGFGREDLLLQVASQLESARPWDTTPVWPATEG
jgi:amidase